MAALTLRQSVAALAAPQVADLRTAIGGMQALTDNRSFSYWAGVHGQPQGLCWHYNQLFSTGQTLTYPLFLPWHRAYLYMFEQAMKDISATSALHWWDWRTDNRADDALPTPYTDLVDASGNPNPLLKSHISLPQTSPPIDEDTVRNPGKGRNNFLPTTADAATAISNHPDLFDFSSVLEGLHDQVHNWVGGNMADLNTAAYDPIFWAHHAMVDRLWWLWQVQYGSTTGVTPDMMSATLAPFPFKVSDVLNIETLGYEYAGTSSEVSA